MSDSELLEMVTEFRRGFLGDRSSRFMCYAICLPLQGYLSFLGIKTELEEVEIEQADMSVLMHWRLRLSDGRVIDPTADQFSGGAPVYIGTTDGVTAGRVPA